MIQFTRPLVLLLLIPLGYYTWWFADRSLADMSRFRSRLALVLRLAIITMLVFALAGARIVRDSTQQCVVFALDVSDSIPKSKQDAALAYVNDAMKSMKSDQKAGLVVFGGDASVELAPSAGARVEKIFSVPSTNNTDISQALGLALASFPEQCSKKIVLLSDGNETIGKSIEQAMLAGADDVSIDAVPVTSDLPREVLLDKVICPAGVKIGEPFDLKVVAVSKQPTVASIRILRNGAPADLKSVDLPAGKSVLAFKQSIPNAGGYEYQALLECPDDTRPENNRALAYVKVTGKPRVLYVEGRQDQAKYLSKALSSSDIVMDTRDRSGIPATMAQLQNYDMVVFSDVPAWNLSPEQMEMIKSGVKDLGIGFTMIGGEDSFGAGGYFDTPIEQALPVDMSVRKTKVLPTLTVVIVMDKSGSMGMVEDGREKIQLANDAAASVVKLLQPIDKVGVVVCHNYPVPAVPLRFADNKGPIYDQISTIRAEGGGIFAVPSMQMAYKMISGSNTRQKHVILMADGADVDDAGPNLVNIARAMAARQITVTTVAFGMGKDVDCLRATAGAGKGYFYLAERARDLKAIFTKDVMQVSKSLILEEPFIPRMDASSQELGGVDAASTPPLLGYVVTSAKPAARVLMTSHKNDPILAVWQYGLGRSAAFTSDCKARWAAHWLTWPDYNKFWAQVVRSTMRKSGPKDYQTTVDIESGTGHVGIDAVDDKGNFLNFLKFAGSIIGPDMRAKPLVVEQTGPGRYEATFDARQVGSYVVSVAAKDRADSAPDVSVISISYPPEYKDMSPDVGLLKRLSQETSGRFSAPASGVFTGKFKQSKTHTDIWRLMMILAMALLPLDVAVRRVAVTPEMLAEVYAAVKSFARGLRARRGVRIVQRTQTMGALLKTKKEAARKTSSADETAQPSIKIEMPAPQVGSARKQPDRQTSVKSSEPARPTPGESESVVGTTSRLLAAKRRARDKTDES